MNRHDQTQLIKSMASDLGFDAVGISKAEHMDEEARHLEEWLSGGNHGNMSYMENHFEKRVDPSRLVPGSKSVISLMYNYYTELNRREDSFKVSMYALGEDYHFIIKRKLKEFLERIRDEIGQVEGRCFVDSAPILERDWARRSGLGWVGKNTLLINPRKGSFYFLAELIIDLELDHDLPIKDHCGTCTRCIDACPTDAISSNGYWLDSSKCISYLTIELRDEIPETFQGQMEDWIFGCDICQEVCPWNRFSTPHREQAFGPRSAILDMDRKEWTDITEEVFREVFKRSPVKRTGYHGLVRNIEFTGRTQHEDLG